MNSNKTMYDALLEASKNYPNDLALFFLGKKVVFSELIKNVNKVASSLSELSLKKGDVVTICMPNIPNAVYLFYACNMLGIVANILHPLLPSRQVLESMKLTKSSILFITDLNVAKFYNDYKDAKIKIITCSIADYLPFPKNIVFKAINAKKIKAASKLTKYSDIVNNANFNKPIVCVKDNKSPVVYLHSGGTTGEPKTIMLSNSNLNTLAFKASEMLGSTDMRGKGMLAVLPMFHGFGLCMSLHAPLINGFASVLVPKFNASELPKLMKATKISYITGVPTMYEALLSNADFANSPYLKDLEFAFCGGDTMPLVLKQRFDEVMIKGNSNCRMYEGYGLTETVTVCTVNTKLNNKKNSIGKPISDTEIKIVDNCGNTLQANALGEICIKSPVVMLGYYMDEQATNSTIRDGFVHSGDLGFVDEEGYVFFKQRLKRIIKVNGVAVYPSEIEDAAANISCVKLSCAIGVKDEKLGEAVKLFISLKDGFAPTDELKSDISNFLKFTLFRFAQPKYIEFRTELPTTAVGKVDYRKLEDEN